MAGRQWSQHRVFKAGWSEHDKCITRLSTIVDAESPAPDQSLRTVRGAVVATAEQIEKAPVGNFNHRIWNGKCNEALRGKLAPHCDVQDARGCSIGGHPAWERALVARPALPKRGVSPHETFNWHVRPRSLPVTGTRYSDGSVREGA